MMTDEKRISLGIIINPIDVDLNEEFRAIIGRLPQDVFAFRTAMGALRGQRVVIDALNLPTNQGDVVRLESDDENQVSVTSTNDETDTERKWSFDGSMITVQDGEAAPVELKADSEGVGAAHFIFSAIQVGVMHRPGPA